MLFSSSFSPPPSLPPSLEQMNMLIAHQEGRDEGICINMIVVCRDEWKNSISNSLGEVKEKNIQSTVQRLIFIFMAYAGSACFNKNGTSEACHVIQEPCNISKKCILSFKNLAFK